MANAVLAEVAVAEPRTGVAVVELTGEHDLLSQRELDDLLDDLIRSHELVVVDISKTEFIDSTFIRGLLIAGRAATTSGKTFRVQAGTTRIVQRAIEVSHVDDVIEFVVTRDDAVRRPATSRQRTRAAG